MISRRQSLSFAVAAASAAPLADALLAPAFAATPAATGKPPAGNAGKAGAGFDPFADPVLTHVRIRGHQDGRRVYFSYHGTFYAQVSGQRTVPMYRVMGASTARMQRQPDGAWLYTMREAGWFCDLASGEPVTEGVNPITGKLVKPRHYNSAQQSRFMPDATVAPVLEKRPPGLEYVGTIGRPEADHDVVWTTEELLVKMAGATPGAPGRVQTSLATFSANRAELDRSPDAFVGCRLGYQTLGSFLGWMEMGDATGVISWRLAGRKSDKLDEVPAAVRARIEREHPEVFEV